MLSRTASLLDPGALITARGTFEQAKNIPKVMVETIPVPAAFGSLFGILIYVPLLLVRIMNVSQASQVLYSRYAY
jgi:hypothetical protein